jgi:hypothetical protein
MWAVWGLGSCASIWGFIRPLSIWGLVSCVSIWFFVSSHMLVHHSALFCMERVECNLNWSRISWSAAEYRCLAWNANLYYWCLACNAWNKLSLQVRDRDKRERKKVNEDFIVSRAFGHMREPVRLRRGQFCAGQGRCGARFSVAVQGPAGDQSVAPEEGEREGDSRGSSEFGHLHLLKHPWEQSQMQFDFFWHIEA